MSPIVSRSGLWRRTALDERAPAGVDIDEMPGLTPDHSRVLRRVGVLSRARLAASNITLLVARIWEDYESEPAVHLAPSASMVSGWVRQARMLDEAKPH